MLAFEADFWAIHNESAISGAIPTPDPFFDGELLVAGPAHRCLGHIRHYHTPDELFALLAQVRWMVNRALPVVGPHRLQAPGAVGCAGLAVPASLPVLHLMLAAAVADAKMER